MIGFPVSPPPRAFSLRAWAPELGPSSSPLQGAVPELIVIMIKCRFKSRVPPGFTQVISYNSQEVEIFLTTNHCFCWAHLVENKVLECLRYKLDRWRNSHVLVYHGPLLSDLVPPTFTTVYLKKHLIFWERYGRYSWIVLILRTHLRAFGHFSPVNHIAHGDRKFLHIPLENTPTSNQHCNSWKILVFHYRICILSPSFMNSWFIFQP